MNLETILGGIGWFLGVHLLLGLVATVPLQARGLARSDPATRGATLGFRLLITPGMLALWPMLCARWRRLGGGSSPALTPTGEADAATPRRLRSAHALAWKGLAVLVPVAVGVALAYRPTQPPASVLPARSTASSSVQIPR